MKKFIAGIVFSVCIPTGSVTMAQVKPQHNLQFSELSKKWDEAIPLGNGMLGALIWEKGGRLRLSLDRADLWDERKAMDITKFNFKWVEEQVLKKNYQAVQKLGDWPYDNIPYPTKLPAAALEFDIEAFGRVISNELDVKTALNTIKFENGITFRSYIHASQSQGFFSFENVSSAQLIRAISPKLSVHNYNNEKTAENDNSHAGEGLQKLGYSQGKVVSSANSIRYKQPTYDGRYYEVLVTWKEFPGNKLIGSWTITNNQPATLPVLITTAKEPTQWDAHVKWWSDFWSKSSVSLPDPVIEKQYYLELYKLG